jgi:hypothetical protein
MRRILRDLYGVGGSKRSKKSLEEWLADEIKATERELAATRSKTVAQKPYGLYLIEKAEKKLERLRKEQAKLEKA